ncbi:MAG: hypothetical protein ACQUYJ_07625, partial [Ferruginibacter sp.]
MLRYLLLLIIFSACQSTSTGDVGVSKELENALRNNDTASAKKIAQRELDKSRSSITDSSFAALMDATLELENLGFKIQKNDTLAIDNEYLKMVHSFVNRVYNFALLRSIQQSDIDYYTAKSTISSDKWRADNFTHKT